MAVVVHIGGGLRSIRPGTLQFSRSTRETGTASCEVLGRQGARSGGEHFRVYGPSGTAIWGGTVDGITRTRLAPRSTEEAYSLVCVSWEQRLRKRYCGSKVYGTENGKDRIIDLVNTYAGDEGIFVVPANISDGATAEVLGKKSYIGMSVADAIDEICSANLETWFIDPGAFLFSKPRNASIASQLIFDNSTKNFFDPVIEEDRNDYLNRVKLAIAFEAFQPQPHTITGDGVLREWTLTFGGNPIAIDRVVTAELNGVVFEIVSSDNNPDADWVFDYGTGVIRQNEDLPALTGTDTLTLSVYVIGQNVIVAENSDDIAARKTIEEDTAIDASGVYEGWFEDLTIKTVEAGTNKATSLLKERNPASNGAPAGSLPRKYVFKARGFIPHAEEIQPGYTVQFTNNSPSTGGTKTLLIETVSAVHQGHNDPADPGVGGGFMVYTVTCVDYVESYTVGDFLMSFGAHSTGGVSGAISVVAGEGAEVTPPAGNMTGLSVETVYVLKQGRWVRQLHCKGLRPDPIGSFRGVILYREEPDYSSGPVANLSGDGSGDWDGTSVLSDPGFDPVPGAPVVISADNQVVIIDDLPPVTVPVQGRIYFNSYNTANIPNTLVRANLAGATPSVQYTSNPPDSGTVTGGLGEEYAPTLLSFTMDGVQPKYKHQSGGDPLWGATFNAEYRTDDVRWPRMSGVKLVFIYPDGAQTSEPVQDLLSKLTTRDDYPVRATGFTIRVCALSVDVNGNVNSIQSNTPYVDLFISPPIGPPGVEYSNAVTELHLVADPYYQLNADGQRQLIIPGFFRIDGTDPRSASGRIMLIRGGGHEVLFESHPEGFFNGEVAGFPIADEPNTYLYVITVNTNGWFNSYVESGPNATPRIGPFVLPAPPPGTVGEERAPRATGFALKNGDGFVNGVRYKYQTGGDPLYQIGVVWDEVDSATQPQTGGYSIVFEYDDGRIGVVADVSVNEAAEWISPDYPLVGSGSDIDILLLTWDVNHRVNSHTHPSTPRVTVTITRTEQAATGGPGQEWLPPLVSFDALTPTIASPDQGGQNPVTRVVLNVVPPSAAGYAGWVPYSISPSGVHIQMGGLITNNTTTVEFPFVPAATEVWTVYGLCQDINGRQNTYNPAVTPTDVVALQPSVAGGPGQEYVPHTTVASVVVLTRRTVDGIEQYRYQIGWSKPVDLKWGSAKVYERRQPGFNNFAYTTMEHIATLHSSDVTPFLTEWKETRSGVDSPYATVSVISVDVNNRENTYNDASTPQIRNLLTQAGTGQLKANRLDPLTFNTNEFDFEAGLFADKNKSVDKLKVGAILKVGGGPTQKPGQIGIFDDTDVMIGWDGKNGSFVGGWRRNFWIGGTSPLDAPFKSVNGAVSLSGVALTVDLGGVKTDISHSYISGSDVGITVTPTGMSPGTNFTMISPYAVKLYSGGLEKWYAGINGIELKNNANIKVESPGTYQISYLGSTLNGMYADISFMQGGISRTLVVRGGIIVSVI